jgi:hypothetical protein
MIATAGRMLTMGGEREMARELWVFLLQIAENEQMKNNAIVHLQQLDALDGIDALTEILETHEARTGLFPESWQELVDTGALRGIPLDPTGVPFVLNPREKKVEVSLESELAGLPR